MLFPLSSLGVSAPLFHGALLTAVLGFGLLFDHMAAPAGARSVRAVESLLLVQEQEREAALYAAASDARLRRRPS